MRVCHSVSASFDDLNLVSCAGLAPVLRLAQRAGLQDLVAGYVRIGRPGGCNTALKVSSLVAGADLTDAVALSMASSWSPLVINLAATEPLPDGDEFAYIDVDDTVRQTFGYAKQGAGRGYTGTKGLNTLLAIVSTPASAAAGAVAARASAGCFNCNEFRRDLAWNMAFAVIGGGISGGVSRVVGSAYVRAGGARLRTVRSGLAGRAQRVLFGPKEKAYVYHWTYYKFQVNSSVAQMGFHRR